MTKKGGLGILKKILKALQQFLSFPTGPGYQDPRDLTKKARFVALIRLIIFRHAAAYQKT